MSKNLDNGRLKSANSAQLKQNPSYKKSQRSKKSTLKVISNPPLIQQMPSKIGIK